MAQRPGLGVDGPGDTGQAGRFHHLGPGGAPPGNKRYGVWTGNMTPVATSEVRVIRASAVWRDKSRAYKVFIDDFEVGSVGDGETAAFTVEPGEHSLRLRIDWTGSPTRTFSARSGEVTEFSCRPGSGPEIVQLIRSIFQRDRYVVLERT